MPTLSRPPARTLLALILLAFSLQACDLLVPAIVRHPPAPAPTPMSATRSETLEDITIRANVINADAHCVVFDLTIEGPAQPYGYVLEITWIYEPQLPGPVLKAGGRELPFLPNTGMFSGAQTADGLPLSSRGMIAFGSSDLYWDQPRLPLHLSLPVLVNNQPFVAPLPVPTGTLPPTGTPTQVPPASHVITFDFTFDVAYDARQVVLEPHQEVESGEVKMTLERIDVTASEARVSVRYSEIQPDTFLDGGNWVAFAELLVGSSDDPGRLTLQAEPEWTCHEGMDRSEGIGSNECVFSFVAPTLIDVAPVDCTLHIEASQNAPKYIGGVGPSPYGIWDFQFTVPASIVK